MNFYLISFIIKHGLMLWLILNLVSAKRQRAYKRFLIILSIIVAWSIGILLIYVFYDGIPWYIAIFHLTSFLLKLLLFYLFVKSFYAIKERAFLHFLAYFIGGIITLIYLDLFIERFQIIQGLSMVSARNPTFSFLLSNNRWPSNIEEALKCKDFKQILEEFNETVNSSIDLGLVAIPEFKIKTILKDSIIICDLYSIGFDNDDDGDDRFIDLRQEFREYRPFLLGLPKLFWYVIIPFPLNGDILVF